MDAGQIYGTWIGGATRWFNSSNWSLSSQLLFSLHEHRHLGGGSGVAVFFRDDWNIYYIDLVSSEIFPLPQVRLPSSHQTPTNFIWFSQWILSLLLIITATRLRLMISVSEWAELFIWSHGTEWLHQIWSGFIYVFYITFVFTALWT